MTLTTIGFDADDTLWHNESLFRLTEERFTELLAEWADPDTLAARLLETEKRNLKVYGYGVKGFTLSMIETAMDLTEGRAPASVIQAILRAGRDMLAHPVETLPEVRETLEALADRWRLVLITKGDLFHQEQKVAQSGLGELFAAVEIVSEKDASTYARLFARHGDGADKAMMVGNSVKSDILPAVEVGAWGAYIPYHTTWELERAEPPLDSPRYVQLERIDQVPALAERIGG
jgi:putative hydrolase of the HAD superfamily